MDKIKFSIITVTFNAEKYIEKTIQSIINQDYDNIEYIIVDGKSTDKTIEIIRSYEEKIKNKCKFQFISEKDKGLYDAMNKAIVIATGDFLWFVNAGDKVYSINTFKEINSIYEKQNIPIDIIYGKTIIIDECENEIAYWHKETPKKLIKKNFLKGSVVCHQSFLVRRTIVGKYNLKYKISADYDWDIQCIDKSRGNLFINNYISKFLTAGVSAANRKLSLKERFKIMRNHFGLIKTLFSHFIIITTYYFKRIISKK